MSTHLDNLPARPGMGSMPSLGDDLGHYLRVLLRYWLLIGVIAVAAGVGAFVLTMTRPVNYTATATILTSPPAYYWRFSSGIQSQLDTRKDWRDDFVPLATQPEVVDAVIQKAGDSLPGALRSRAALPGHITVTKSDSAGLTITANSNDAQIAANLANLWSQALVEKINHDYGPQRDSQSFQQALDQAKQRLSQADEKVRAFRAERGIDLGTGGTSIATDNGTLYSNQGKLKQLLILKNSALAEYHQALDNLDLLITQANAAQAAGKTSTAISFELLDNAVLRRRAVLTPDNVRSRPIAEVIAALQDEKAVVEQGYKQLDAEAQALQTQYAAELLDLERLYRDQTTAYEAVQQLERKMSELRAQAVVDDMRATVASTAQVPSVRTGVHPGRNAALGVVLGLVFGALLALLLDYISPKPQTA